MPISARLMLLLALAAIFPSAHAQSVDEPVFGAPVKRSALTKSKFVLQKDQPIHEALQAWCRSEGWDLTWYPAKSWKVFRSYEMDSSADLATAISEVVDILRDEGKPIRLKISEGNRVMEVISTEVRND